MITEKDVKDRISLYTCLRKLHGYDLSLEKITAFSTSTTDTYSIYAVIDLFGSIVQFILMVTNNQSTRLVVGAITYEEAVFCAENKWCMFDVLETYEYKKPPKELPRYDPNVGYIGLDYGSVTC